MEKLISHLMLTRILRQLLQSLTNLNRFVKLMEELMITTYSHQQIQVRHSQSYLYSTDLVMMKTYTTTDLLQHGQILITRQKDQLMF